MGSGSGEFIIKNGYALCGTHNINVALEPDEKQINVYIFSGDYSEYMFDHQDKLSTKWIACSPIRKRRCITFPEDIPEKLQVLEQLYAEFTQLHEFRNTLKYPAKELYETLRKNLPGCDEEIDFV